MVLTPLQPFAQIHRFGEVLLIDVEPIPARQQDDGWSNVEYEIGEINSDAAARWLRKEFRDANYLALVSTDSARISVLGRRRAHAIVRQLIKNPKMLIRVGSETESPRRRTPLIDLKPLIRFSRKNSSEIICSMGR